MEWINFNQTQKTKYFSSRLNKGLCSSLKIERPDDFKDFMELFKNHPEYSTKLTNVVDLCIVVNKKNHKYFEINLIKSDKTVDDISYRICISLKHKNKDLYEALRYSIYEQIKEFKNKSRLICVKCKSLENIHIDHVNTFKSLTDNFLRNRKDIPSSFDNTYYNSSMFKTEDKKINDEWFDYHKENAVLRCLCRNCNLTRKKK
jgi:hypothetical protein